MKKKISACFLTIQKKMEEMEYDYKVIVVNDGSTDETKEIIASFKDQMPVEIIAHYPIKA
jgi:glycosyltransferase involved in cell wall biosynthesis|tara:strand:- start:89 stop:268 length:180 start_codon:yes stop_codon:yes gene_type:complete